MFGVQRERVQQKRLMHINAFCGFQLIKKNNEFF